MEAARGIVEADEVIPVVRGELEDFGATGKGGNDFSRPG
jgi:hypothetical protein